MKIMKCSLHKIVNLIGLLCTCFKGSFLFLGKYLFIETSSPRKVGDKAWLVSDYFNKSVSCFTFWYHMFGGTIGSLNIYQQPLGGQRTLLWRLTGNKGNKWFSGQVVADFSNKETRVGLNRVFPTQPGNKSDIV